MLPGQVSGELVHALAGVGEVIAQRRTDLDLSDEGSVRVMVRRGCAGS